MAQINPYIHFNGNAEEAFTFYNTVFGGTFTRIMRYGDLSNDQFPIPEQDKNRLMHIALPIRKSNMLLGSDVLSVMGQVTENDNRNTISVSAESREEADRLFTGLSEGGAIEMPISDGPMGAYFGMLTDRFGVQWMVTFAGKDFRNS